MQAFTGDVLDPDTLAPAFDGCYAAYHVAYSIGTNGDFTATEATARSTRRPTPGVTDVPTDSSENDGE